MTDTIESLRAERDALKAEVETHRKMLLFTQDERNKAEADAAEHKSKREEYASEARSLRERLKAAERIAEQESDLRRNTEADVCNLAALVRYYRADHDDRTHEGTGGDDNGCYCPLCDRADELGISASEEPLHG